MKKGVKIALVLVSVSSVYLIGIALLKRIKRNKVSEEKLNTLSKDSKMGYKPNFPLKKGDGMGDLAFKSSLVIALQKHLNRISPSPLLPMKVDGKFGDNTEKRLLQMYNVSYVSEKLFNDKIKYSFSKDDLFSW
jgi:hypothetical protein